MIFKQEHIRSISLVVLDSLERNSLLELKSKKEAVVDRISKTIQKSIEDEQKLIKDSEALLDEAINSMGIKGASVDRYKMLNMIKQKLAKERKIIL